MKPNVIRFDRQVCSRLDLALSREWLETNGIGGFASSTIAGLNTRRYHCLLTAATAPPGGRVLLFSKVEEAIVLPEAGAADSAAPGQRRFELASNEYSGAIHPPGYALLEEFRLDPMPTFVFRTGGIEIEKRVFMVNGENTTVIEYEARSVDGGPVPECTLEIRPLVAFRDFHATTHANETFNAALDIQKGRVSLAAYPGLPALNFFHNAANLENEGRWYYNFEYRVERDRGLDFQEDLFQPFALRFTLNHRKPAVLIASTEQHDSRNAAVLRSREIRRREAVAAAAPVDQPLVRALTAAADHYIVRRGAGKTIVAGYHWYSDWGRDTMIALPGLTLVTGRFGVAKQVLQAFAENVDQGMLPVRLPDPDETAEYGSADATLWFFEAARAYLHYSSDEAFVRDVLYPKLKDILRWHMRGTRHGIRADSDGLLQCGEPGFQLTWMDAKVGDWVVTPRTGKPVEIQALWYNALCIVGDLAARFGDTGPEILFRGLAREARAGFEQKFWNEDVGCLYDVIDGGQADGSIRPNQIIAASLTHSMLSADRARAVVETVQRELLTPLGLRTLSQHDPRYRARCEGGVNDRETACHLGTVWPWLMGPFLTAYIKVNGQSDAARREAGEWLTGFAEHLTHAGLGHISEIADAEFPHTPRGCIAQAWSVAEILRAAVEDVYAVQVPRESLKRRASKAVSAPVLARAAKS